MLLTLKAKNFFTFDSFYIELDDGLNVITGESGSGKSLIMRAIKSLTGDPVQHNSEKDDSFVEGTFVANPELKSRAKELGLNIPSEEFLINVSFGPQRILYRLDGQIIPKQLVQKLFDGFIEIHSQLSSVKLLNSSTHYKILDQTLPAALKKTYQETYQKLVETKTHLQKIKMTPEELEREKEYLKFQLNELGKANLKHGEMETVESRYSKILDSQKLKDTFDWLMNMLRDDQESLYNQLWKAVKELKDFEKYGYSELIEHSNVALEEIEYLYHFIESELEDISIDDDEYQKLEYRFNIIQGLKRKYGQTEDEIFKTWEDLENKFEELENSEQKREELIKTEKILKEKLIKTGKEIDELRAKNAEKIEKSIIPHLEDLKMTGARVKFELIPEHEPKYYGTSKVTILARTNPGGDTLELNKIASGGELSRILLAIESALKKELKFNTIIFDEIDSGVGARMGNTLAEKLVELTENLQTVVITHLPQIASKASKHFAVKKNQFGDSIVSDVVHLKQDERLVELEKMYGRVEFESD
ncbi:MAG: DNA repair protein RecN [Kosmotogaceae bacterium]